MRIGGEQSAYAMGEAAALRARPPAHADLRAARDASAQRTHQPTRCPPTHPDHVRGSAFPAYGAYLERQNLKHPDARTPDRASMELKDGCDGMDRSNSPSARPDAPRLGQVPEAGEPAPPPRRVARFERIVYEDLGRLIDVVA